MFRLPLFSYSFGAWADEKWMDEMRSRWGYEAEVLKKERRALIWKRDGDEEPLADNSYPDTLQG